MYKEKTTVGGREHEILPLQHPGINPDGMYNVVEHYNHNMKAWAIVLDKSLTSREVSLVRSVGSSERPDLWPDLWQRRCHVVAMHIVADMGASAQLASVSFGPNRRCEGSA
jgi:hypothetical protein